MLTPCSRSIVLRIWKQLFDVADIENSEQERFAKTPVRKERQREGNEGRMEVGQRVEVGWRGRQGGRTEGGKREEDGEAGRKE
jgi:hypothetical protein